MTFNNTMQEISLIVFIYVLFPPWESKLHGSTVRYKEMVAYK